MLTSRDSVLGCNPVFIFYFVVFIQIVDVVVLYNNCKQKEEIVTNQDGKLIIRPTNQSDTKT